MPKPLGQKTLMLMQILEDGGSVGVERQVLIKQFNFTKSELDSRIPPLIKKRWVEIVTNFEKIDAS